MMVLAFVGRRLLLTAAVLLMVSFIVFALLSFSPGSSVAALLGGHPSTPKEVEHIKAEYHLNDPFLLQYWNWLGRALHGDLGHSVQSGESVAKLIGQRLGVTLELVGLTVMAVLLVGVPAGFIAGVKSGGWIDRSLSTAAVFGLSAPVFVVGLLLVYLFGIQLGWFPVYGAGEGFSDRLAHLVLPATALALSLGALVVRQTRAAVLTVMEQDYITFARARGLSSVRIICLFALRNSALPILTASGLLAVYAISGTVLVETVFSLPGLGSLLTRSIQNKDIPVAQGVAIVVAVSVVLINIGVDLCALILDPRLRHSRNE